MSSQQQLNIDRYVVIHVATTCDEHGVYVTKDSAEVIELGWILVDATSLEEVRTPAISPWRCHSLVVPTTYKKGLQCDTRQYHPFDHG